MSKACDIINGALSTALKDKEILPVRKIDDAIQTFRSRAEEDGDAKIGANITDAVSQALYMAFGKALSPQSPYESMFKNSVFRDYRPSFEKVPKLMFTVLVGGKEMSSKVKFSKFYVIMDINEQDCLDHNAHETYLKLVAAIEKGVSSTKGGLAAFKRQPDGSFFNAYDNINECFKLLEEAIVTIGINNDTKKFLKIGVNTDAQNWFADGKYEWEGPKTQWDSDQLSDFYDKLVNDHPLVEFLEDGFAKTDIKGYKKYIAK
jgi:enolase